MRERWKILPWRGTFCVPFVLVPWELNWLDRRTRLFLMGLFCWCDHRLYLFRVIPSIKTTSPSDLKVEELKSPVSGEIWNFIGHIFLLCPTFARPSRVQRRERHKSAYCKSLAACFKRPCNLCVSLGDMHYASFRCCSVRLGKDKTPWKLIHVQAASGLATVYFKCSVSRSASLRGNARDRKRKL